MKLKKVFIMLLIIIFAINLTGCNGEGYLKADPYEQFEISFVEGDITYKNDNYKKIEATNALEIRNIGKYPVKLTISTKVLNTSTNKIKEYTDSITVKPGETKFFSYYTVGVEMQNNYNIIEAKCLQKKTVYIEATWLVILIAIIWVFLWIIISDGDSEIYRGAGVLFILGIAIAFGILWLVHLMCNDPVGFIFLGSYIF